MRDLIGTLFALVLLAGCGSKALRDAEALIETKDYERAEGILELETKASPKGAQGFLLLGKVRLLLGKAEAAQEAFDHGLPLDPNLRERIGPTYLTAARSLYDSNKRQFAPQIRLYVARARKYSTTLPPSDSDWMKQVESELVSPREASSISMAHLRTIAIGLEGYAVDKNAYPISDDLDAVLRLLKPTYLKSETADAARLDGWGNPIKLHSEAEHYRLVSAGSDGQFSESTWSSAGSFADPAEDIVFSDGQFTRTWILAAGR